MRWRKRSLELRGSDDDDVVVVVAVVAVVVVEGVEDDVEDGFDRRGLQEEQLTMYWKSSGIPSPVAVDMEK